MKIALVSVCLVTVLLVMPGCKRANTREPEPALVTAVPLPSQPVSSESQQQTQKNGRITMRNQLLEQAERALNHNRLTRPPQDNAFDKFSAVLLLEPGNAQAQAGLDVVQMELTNLAKNAMARNRLREARDYVNTLNSLFPGTSLTAEVNSALRQAEQRARNRQAAEDAAADPSKHPIPLKYIRSDSDESSQWFGALAGQIQAKDASVLIFARSDAEGRWLYKALKAGAPGYLIRGDIRISQTPVIQLLEPLP